MTHSSRRARSGFTLVEVLASLALVGIILPTTLAGISLAMSLMDEARELSEIATLTAGKLDEIVVTGDWQTGETEGDFGEEWQKYRWQKEVIEWEEASMREVRLTVRWRSRGRDRSYVMSTLVYSGEQ
jgi:prepilin-type N-terminal cleavage/methylation domain-containing protein